MHNTNAWPMSSSWMNCTGRRRRWHRQRQRGRKGQASDDETETTTERLERRRQHSLRSDGAGPENDRRPQEKEREARDGTRPRHPDVLQPAFLEVEESAAVGRTGQSLSRTPTGLSVRNPGGHHDAYANRMAPGRCRGTEGAQSALDVDLTRGFAATPAPLIKKARCTTRSAPSQVAVREGSRILPITSAILHLRPTVGGRIERPARHTRRSGRYGRQLAAGDETEAEGARRTGHRDGESAHVACSRDSRSRPRRSRQSSQNRMRQFRLTGVRRGWSHPPQYLLVAATDHVGVVSRLRPQVTPIDRITHSNSDLCGQRPGRQLHRRDTHGGPSTTGRTLMRSRPSPSRRARASPLRAR